MNGSRVMIARTIIHHNQQTHASSLEIINPVENSSFPIFFFFIFSFWAGENREMMRGNGRSMAEAACSGIVRRMVSLPRSIIGGVSRAMGHAGMVRYHHRARPSLPLPDAVNVLPEEWVFLDSFEQQYGSDHPFFYACQFKEALKIAEDEQKFVFVYLHSPDHPFTAAFCGGTLCAEVVVQFLDANFVSWGAVANRGEGVLMTSTLRPASFPFCSVVAPVAGNSLAVLQQIEGPVSPAELVEILQRTEEEQGLAFGSGRAVEEEKRRADAQRAAMEEEQRRAHRQIRAEQDAAYLAALQIDREKDKLKNFPLEQAVPQPTEAPKKVHYEEFSRNPTKKDHGKGKVKEAASSIPPRASSESQNREKDAQTTQILVRFPNGGRKEKSFRSTDKIESVYRYIDSLGLPGIGSYRLVSSFPRRVFGVDQMGTSLKDAGLHPRASLFLELL
ncbi:plant UBX domain-containing protein 10-like [Malania oleifera]|uniref:plant UBX domain-containing protein 10-like n=1 Tax=Malania oleifera TaxID=397392 RepID=UPI0025AE4F3C|nr:plant UBX domain-containing protein 10-like [Malania oleifera]